MQTLFQDVRYGLRMLLKRPGFAFIAVITLALGIGANTAIFSIVNAVLLRPLTFQNQSEIVTVWTLIKDENKRFRATNADFLDWQQRSRSFDSMAAFGAASFNLTGEGEPEQVLGVSVTADYFKALGIKPSLGRTFTTDENESGKEKVVILSHGLWQRRFGADKNIIGRKVNFDGNSYDIVGIMPSGVYPAWPATSGKISFASNEQQFWIPISFTPQARANRRSHVLGVIGRLKAGVTLEQAQKEMTIISNALEQENPNFNQGLGITVAPFMDEMVGSVRPALFILLAAVGFVLLITCANVASLLLARLTARHQEIAIRTALGASRFRVIRQLLAESFLLAILGGALGILIAFFGVDLMMKIIPQEIPRLNQVSIDITVLSFTFLLSIITCLAVGLIPALQSSQTDLHESLKTRSQNSATKFSRQYLRNALVVFQISVAVVLIIGTGLLIRSFQQLNKVSLGFNPDKVVVASISLPTSKYSEWHQVSGFYTELVERLKNSPEVQSAAIGYDHPLKATWIDSFTIEGRDTTNSSDALSGWLRSVSYEYFRTMGISMISGREFNELDDTKHPGAIIINEAFAKRFFPDENPLGKKLRTNTPAMNWGKDMPTSFEVVGIVRNVRFRGLNVEPEPAFYIPAKQFPISDMTVLVRTKGDPLALVSSIRKTVLDLDANQPIAQVQTMTSIFDEQLAQSKFNMLLMGFFGVIALVLVSVGIYGLLSYLVTQRTHEIGIRMALGAKAEDMLRLVIGQGMRLAIIGVVIGLLASIALTRLMTSLLYGVSTTDKVTFILVPLILIGVSFLACFVPARRASKVDPMIALRYE